MMICSMSKATDNKSIQISAEAMTAVERMLGVYGVRVTKKDLIERIILWMDAQTDVVKGSIMGTIPPSHRVDIARMELERLARPNPRTLPDAMRGAQAVKDAEGMIQEQMKREQDRKGKTRRDAG